jgi:hypothetical protein
MPSGFGEGSPSVMVGAFPVRPAYETDFPDRTVSLNQGGFMVKDRADPRWSYEPKSPPAGARVTAAPVLGAVADDFPGGGEVSASQ